MRSTVYSEASIEPKLHQRYVTMHASLGFIRACFTVIALTFVAAPAHSTMRLDIAYSALLKMLHQQIYRQQGRAYMQGGPGSPCTYAYLDQPRVNPQNQRLALTSQFVGRAAVAVSSGCLGTDESRMRVSISGVPQYKNGVIILADPRIAVPEGPYAELIRNYFAATLAPLLRFPLLDEVRNQLAQAGSQTPYHFDLRQFDIPSITVHPDRLRIEGSATLGID